MNATSRVVNVHAKLSSQAVSVTSVHSDSTVILTVNPVSVIRMELQVKYVTQRLANVYVSLDSLGPDAMSASKDFTDFLIALHVTVMQTTHSHRSVHQRMESANVCHSLVETNVTIALSVTTGILNVIPVPATFRDHMDCPATQMVFAAANQISMEKSAKSVGKDFTIIRSVNHAIVIPQESLALFVDVNLSQLANYANAKNVLLEGSVTNAKICSGT